MLGSRCSKLRSPRPLWWLRRLLGRPLLPLPRRRQPPLSHLRPAPAFRLPPPPTSSPSPTATRRGLPSVWLRRSTRSALLSHSRPATVGSVLSVLAGSGSRSSPVTTPLPTWSPPRVQ